MFGTSKLDSAMRGTLIEIIFSSQHSAFMFACTHLEGTGPSVSSFKTATLSAALLHINTLCLWYNAQLKTGTHVLALDLRTPELQIPHT
jgi:hypothetical protein